jgi:hypothetical protein
LTQLVVHAAALHRYGVQSWVAGTGGAQLPLPLQSSLRLRTVALSHAAAAHGVPGGQRLHWPTALHPPSLPQLLSTEPGQSPSGSVPGTTRPHVPSEPCPFLAAEQAMHIPVHGELQQTPSTQNPAAQSAPTSHFLPGPHVVPHVLFGAVTPPQSMSVSVPSCLPLLQTSMPKQPSDAVPQVRFSATQVVVVQPQ